MSNNAKPFKSEKEELSSNDNIGDKDLNLWLRYRTWQKKRKEKEIARRKEIGWLRDWIETIVSVVLIVFVIRVAVIEAYRIPTGSMEDTLLVGDFLLVNKFIYGIRTPDWLGIPFTELGFKVPYFRFPRLREVTPGDIIVFRYPLNQRVNYIKRCIAEGGQTVEIKDKQVFVDGIPFELPKEGKFTSNQIIPKGYKMRHIVPRGAGNKDNYGPIKVPEGQYFVMGDNRDNSADSRFWGFLDEDLILGRAMIIYFSWDKNVPFYRFWEKIRWTRFARIIK